MYKAPIRSPHLVFSHQIELVLSCTNILNILNTRQNIVGQRTTIYYTHYLGMFGHVRPPRPLSQPDSRAPSCTNNRPFTVRTISVYFSYTVSLAGCATFPSLYFCFGCPRNHAPPLLILISVSKPSFNFVSRLLISHTRSLSRVTS